MKRLVKRIIGISFSLILLFSNNMQVQAASTDVYIKMSFPANGRLDLKPFSVNQIASTSPAYFVNTAPETDNVVYKVSIDGYSCVTQPKNAQDPIKVVQGFTGNSTIKYITAKLELGQVQDKADMTNDAKQFREDFVSEKFLDVTSVQNASYDGKKVTSYKKTSKRNDSVSIEPQMCAPFRITGEMNERANWLVGDKIIIVPIFQITVSKR